MRWFHQSLDRLHVGLVRRVIPPVFAHESTSLPLEDHLSAVHLDVPPLRIDVSGPQRYRLTAETLMGAVEVRYHVRLGARPNLPVLVYHHGIAEMPYDRNFRGIFRTRQPVPAHLVAVQAPFHNSWLTLREGISTLSHFMTMCAVSVILMEAVRELLSAKGATGSVMAGTSLGGFVALLHHLRIGTADRYVPLLAGPDLAHVMLTSLLQRFLAPEALAQASHIQSLLDYRSAFQASDTQRVYPLLARYDLDVMFAHHHACYAESGVPVTSIDRAHITGSLAFRALRQHLLACLKPLVPTRLAGNQEEMAW